MPRIGRLQGQGDAKVDRSTRKRERLNARTMTRDRQWPLCLNNPRAENPEQRESSVANIPDFVTLTLHKTGVSRLDGP